MLVMEGSLREIKGGINYKYLGRHQFWMSWQDTCIISFRMGILENQRIRDMNLPLESS